MRHILMEIAFFVASEKILLTSIISYPPKLSVSGMVKTK